MGGGAPRVGQVVREEVIQGWRNAGTFLEVQASSTRRPEAGICPDTPLNSHHNLTHIFSVCNNNTGGRYRVSAGKGHESRDFQPEVRGARRYCREFVLEIVQFTINNVDNLK